MLTTAGGINVLSDSPIRYPRIDMEEIILKDPEVIIAPTDLIVLIDVWKKRWGGISAITHGNVYPINPDIISRPGPRIVDGLEQIYEYIHGTQNLKIKYQNDKEISITGYFYLHANTHLKTLVIFNIHYICVLRFCFIYFIVFRVGCSKTLRGTNGIEGCNHRQT